MEWQPIETCPKDNIVLLFWSTPHSGHNITIERKNLSYRALEDLNGKIKLQKATHWMPLPEPPHDPE